MDLYNDFEDLKKFWRQRSSAGKAFLMLAFMFSILSFGSVANSVYEFRGFIVTAMNFYLFVTEPIRTWISTFVHMEIPRSVFDGIIIFALYFGAFFRAVAVYSASEVRPRWVTVTILIVGLIPIGWALNKLHELIGVFSYYAALPLLPIYYALAVNKTGRLGREDRFTILYILSVYFAVALLAAISEGLTRIAPVT